MGTQIWGNSHQVQGRQRRLRHQHIPVCQNILGNLGFKQGKQAPLLQESLRAGVEPTAAFPIHRWDMMVEKLKESRRVSVLLCAPWKWFCSFQPRGKLSTCH